MRKTLVMTATYMIGLLRFAYSGAAVTIELEPDESLEHEAQSADDRRSVW